MSLTFTAAFHTLSHFFNGMEALNGRDGMSDLHYFGWQGRSLSMGRFTVSARGMRIAFLVGAALVSIGVVLQIVALCAKPG